ncbi:MAG: putative NRPS-like protein biosynthetic cluster [Bogoriella megaspora]|nr:MAG: putative NRPS-like protein biosynthetic cluster [Bogoriella megaspora]
MFCPEEQVSVPTLDLLTWTFENVDRFPDHPVRSPVDRTDYGAGGCFVGANPAYTYLELRHLLSISRAKLLIVDPDLLANILPAASKCRIPDSNIFIFDTSSKRHSENFKNWRTLLNHGEQHWVSFDDEAEAKNTISSLMLTSGTTGLPKAAAISHYAQVAQGVMIRDLEDKPYSIKLLLSLPQFHSFVITIAHLKPVREGQTAYIMKRYEPKQYLKYINLYGITETAMVPPIVLNLLSLSPSEQRQLSHLRYIRCAGAPLSADTYRRFTKLLDPKAIFAQIWGMSETGWITTFPFPELDDSGSVGRLMPSMEAKIIAQDGTHVLEDNHPGEIYVRGPSLMSGYLANSEATQLAFAEGWLRTGDIGYCEKGRWYITDRAKELIKVRGWQVSPTELEACLLTHPSIIDAAVIGVELSEQSGELPRAYIVLKASGSGRVTEADIQTFVKERLAKYKALGGGVKFLGRIPKGASGKILRKQLKEMAAEELRVERSAAWNGANGTNGYASQVANDPRSQDSRP